MNKYYYEFLCDIIDISTISVSNSKTETVYFIDNNLPELFGSFRLIISYSNNMIVLYSLIENGETVLKTSKTLLSQSTKNTNAYFMENLAKKCAIKIIDQEKKALQFNMLKYIGNQIES